MPDLSRRRLIQRTAVSAAAAPLVLGLAACIQEDGEPDAPDDTPVPTPPEDPTSRRPLIHLTPHTGWIGDPQRPVQRDGVVHLYGLHHAEEAAPGPTAWAHWTSTDLVTFTHEGTALEGEDGPDVWSGSAVIDEHGTAGLGDGAVVALATRPTDGRAELQEQYLAVSEDAVDFRLEPDPVLPNPDGPTAHSEEEIAQASWFRDPKLLRDEDRDQWVCAIGRDHRVALWTSPDLRSWEPREDFAYLDLADDLPDLGGVECPDLFTLIADDGTAHWVLGASLDGNAEGEPTNYAYWVGTWDGDRFTPEYPAPRWLDRGWDWYAAVTWPSAEDPEHVRHATGWMNNWAYAREASATAESDGYDGQYSLVREVRLVRDDDGALTLVSAPVPALAEAAHATRDLDDVEVDGEVELGELGRAYALELDLEWSEAAGAAVTVLGAADGSRGTRISLGDGALTVDRSGSPIARDAEDGDESFAGLTSASAPIDPAARTAHLHLVVDTQSVEVFLDDGRSTLSLTVHPSPGEETVRLHSADGVVRCSGIQVREF